MIELYVFPPSPRAFKAMAVANHLGVNWTMRVLDVMKEEHKRPDYAALNPNMRMPTLKEGDYVLWESNAIIQYLAGKKKESGLLPAGGRMSKAPNKLTSSGNHSNAWTRRLSFGSVCRIGAGLPSSLASAIKA